MAERIFLEQLLKSPSDGNGVEIPEDGEKRPVCLRLVRFQNNFEAMTYMALLESDMHENPQDKPGVVEVFEPEDKRIPGWILPNLPPFNWN